MQTVVAGAAGLSEARGRWVPAYTWLAGLVAYLVAIVLTSDRAAIWINDIAWTLTSAGAAWACLRTSRRVERPRRRAWLLLGLGCVSWLIGQLHWNYSQLVLGVGIPFPSIGQIFFSAFAPFVIAAVLLMPEARERAQFTFKHLGNIGLVTCCLVMTIVLGTLEPALQSRVPGFYLVIAVVHTLLVAATFLTALYALWTYRWSASWMPMLLLVHRHRHLRGCESRLCALAADQQLSRGRPDQRQLADHVRPDRSRRVRAGVAEPARRSASRRRACSRTSAGSKLSIPALLIIIMVVVAVGSSSTLTHARHLCPLRSCSSCSRSFSACAKRGSRTNRSSSRASWWLTNEQLQSANVELRLSEARYRELATALEQRVSERTIELKRAYDELEGFSYAVAHDLKAPLRAINGFAHLFEAEMDGQLSPQAREHLARIRNGSLRMATLIDDLLAYSHIDRRGLQSSVVALPELVDSVLLQYADEVQRRHVELSRAKSSRSGCASTRKDCRSHCATCSRTR